LPIAFLNDVFQTTFFDGITTLSKDNLAEIPLKTPIQNRYNKA
jgi:hypothetical protein